MKVQLRCSQLPLFMKCPSSARPAEHPVQPVSEAAAVGRAAHEALAAIITTPDQCPELQALADRFHCDADELEFLVERGRRVWDSLAPSFERPVAEMGVGYVGEGWVLSGHIDICDHDAPVFIDFKTGRVHRDYSDQLAGYALCLSRCEWDPPRDHAKGLVAPLRFWRDEMLEEGIEYPFSRAEAYAQTITDKVALIGAAWNPGEHCAFCPHQNDCEALREWGQHALVLLRDIDTHKTQPPATPEDVAHLHVAVREAAQILKRAQEYIRYYIEQRGPVPLGNGKELCLETAVREEIEPRTAWPLLLSQFSEDELASAVKVRKGALEKAFRAQVEKGNKGAAWKGFLRGLREAGALKTSLTESVRERKEQKDD